MTVFNATERLRQRISAADEATGRHAEWPDPKPLPDGLPSVGPFVPNLLPAALRPWVMDISERMQCPPDFIAATAIVALGSVIGAGAASVLNVRMTGRSCRTSGAR